MHDLDNVLIEPDSMGEQSSFSRSQHSEHAALEVDVLECIAMLVDDKGVVLHHAWSSLLVGLKTRSIIQGRTSLKS